MPDLFCTNTCAVLIHVVFVTSFLGSSGWQMHAAAFWPPGRHREGTWEWWPYDDRVEKLSLRGLQLCERSRHRCAGGCVLTTMLKVSPI